MWHIEIKGAVLLKSGWPALSSNEPSFLGWLINYLVKGPGEGSDSYHTAWLGWFANAMGITSFTYKLQP
jgi:hypothetical protein